jgi:acylphosphatase
MAGDANMTIQAILIISGDVQSVGYREYVYRQAVRLGLTGLVRNIDEKKVWIVCEGEPDKIEEFIRDIKVNDALAKVDSIDRQYGDARGCYDTFLVTRDLRFNGLPEAKLELGVEYLTKLLNSVDGIKDSINHMDIHLSDGFNGMRSTLEKVDDHIENMDSNMGQRFDRLDGKYGEFGNSLKGIGKSMKGMASDMNGMASDMKDMKGSMSGISSDIHEIKLAAFPPKRRIRKQVLKQARSRS